MPAKSKKQKKFMQAVANNPEFAKKVGVKQTVGKEFTKEKGMKKVKKMNMGGNTSRMNRTEELGRVDAERADTASGRRNLSDEKSRIRGELGMKKGGKVKKMMKGGTVKGSASKRADGIITQGHTRGRMV
tara:strand:+ start:1210 stop:1599 length:390 start_codon:yes stop_codon:yes gene_type:complete